MRSSEMILPALKTAAEAALDYLAAIDNRRVAPDAQALMRLQELQFPLGDEPVDAAEVIRSLHAYGSPATVASAGGRFFGLVVGATLR